jgi:small subunit ribosomal protein S3
MGQKSNPTGLRVGTFKNWGSVWFGDKKSIPSYVVEDKLLRDFLMSRLASAGIERVNIERSFGSIKITVVISKPGIVIGKGGAGISLLRDQLKKLSSSKIDLVVEEIRELEKSAYLTARNIADQIERRIPYKRAVVFALQKAMDKGVKGIKIEVSGLLGGASSIGRVEKYTKGSVPTQTLRNDIDYAVLEAKPKYGSIGIKIWINRGEFQSGK